MKTERRVWFSNCSQFLTVNCILSPYFYVKYFIFKIILESGRDVLSTCLAFCQKILDMSLWIQWFISQVSEFPRILALFALSVSLVIRLPNHPGTSHKTLSYCFKVCRPPVRAQSSIRPSKNVQHWYETLYFVYFPYLFSVQNIFMPWALFSFFFYFNNKDGLVIQVTTLINQ